MQGYLAYGFIASRGVLLNVHPFHLEGGVVCRALECEPRSLGLGKVAGRAPKPLHGARGRSGVPLAFCATLAHPFRLEGGVVCRALECEPRSLGFGLVVGRAPEPPHGARGRSGVPLAFYVALAHPFRSEGGVVCRALECKPGSLGLGKVAGRAPEPLHGARGRSGVPLARRWPDCSKRRWLLLRHPSTPYSDLGQRGHVID